MKIEIAEPGRMTQTGSSLLKLIQNNNMPVLDLLVRESIQNSLDARKQDSKYVDVDYITGSFNSRLLSAELEGITDALNSRFTGKTYEFIAVRDSNTVGLTGEMDYKKIKNNEYGNLLKLVYEICKPQEAEGAGGSWGLGKTVYFRIGIGLVIYYSRIKTGTNTYESRLAASFVENENYPSAMIPVYHDQAKRGIAWWGKKIDENVTEPVTDDTYISEFLKIFGVCEYTGDETGTTIIIPYINSDSLLANNQIEYLDGKGNVQVPYWCHSIEEYLKVAVQRWFAPRLNNIHYTHGAYLRMRINGNGLAGDEMEPAFKVIQALYNRANYVSEEDILTDSDAETNVDGIKIMKYLTDQKVGVVAYSKLPRDLLKMGPPFNKPEPYMYFNCEIHDEDVNRPTICYTRQPGMIVSYENVGVWTSSIAPTAKDEYIMAVFVLNSWNQMKNSPTQRSLEEYVRHSEMADHTSWSDWSEGSYNPRIITKIQNGVNKLISKEFAPTDSDSKPRVNSGLGKLFGDMLLPPDGFGKLPGGGSKPPAQGNTGKNRGVKFQADADHIKHLPDRMIVPLLLETQSKRKMSYAGVEIMVDSESKKIGITEWEEKMGLLSPFEIEDLMIEILYVDGRREDKKYNMSSEENEAELSGFKFVKRMTANNTGYGLRITADEAHSVKARIIATIKLNRKDIKPAFIFEKENLNG